MEPIIAEHLFQEELYLIPGRLTIVIPSGWHAISDDNKTQLSKILAAVKLKPEMVHIMTKPVITEAALVPFSPPRVISFGVPFSPEVKPYELAMFQSTKVIFADALDQLDDLRKRNLWLALKTMFSI